MEGVPDVAGFGAEGLEEGEDQRVQGGVVGKQEGVGSGEEV